MIALYTVSEAAKILSVARVTIYRNIVTPELQAHILEENNVKYIDDVGFEILRAKFNTTNTCNSEMENLLHEVTLLQHETNHLKRELVSKQEHITTLKGDTEKLQDANRDLIRLLENSQVLLKQEQDKVLLLEEKNRQPWWKKMLK